MTGTATRRTVGWRGRVTGRWPTGLAIVTGTGAVTVAALVDDAQRLFGPSIATMAGIYLMAYALGRPRSAWLAFVVLSAVVSVLQVLRLREVPGVDPAIGMTVLLVPLWLWALARRRWADGSATFFVQTAGMVGFGALTLLCAAVNPKLGVSLAGVGFLAHAGWDAYHFAVDRVVDRPWSEFCCGIDLAVGAALLVVAAAV